MQTTPSAEKK